MGDDRTITVAERSDGACADGTAGAPVSMPVVELLTGRGFVTGKSGSGKSNTCSVIAEKLLDNGFGLLIVDIDGEYYGLKEEYEILHAGADEECDIRVTPDHAEKLATLALEQNVPIILDVSSFLDESEARDLLTAVAKQLFVKAKKLKQPFLLLVEEIHEYIPENGSIDECGRMLIKIGKRGRKHGLGITGISQRPADVKKDFITQCDWLVWHRLTWNNDTTVVRRVLDGAYADAVEDLDDGEGFLMTDWSESVRRVQFHRKRTFDAGATPGLEDVDRPELKSVSDDLVSELETISDQRRERDDEIARLKAELDKKNSRIAELERELRDARDLSRMADQFVGALVEEVQGAEPGRTEVERMRSRRAYRETGDPRTDDDRTPDSDDPVAETDAEPSGASDGDVAAALGVEDDPDETFEAAMAAVADDGGADVDTDEEDTGSETATGESTNGDVPSFPSFEEPDDAPTVGDDGDSEAHPETDPLAFSEADVPEFGFKTPEEAAAGPSTHATGGDEAGADGSGAEGDRETPAGGDPEGEGAPGTDTAVAAAVNEVSPEPDSRDRPETRSASVSTVRRTIRNLDAKSRRMLAHYHHEGPATPLDAHFVAGGSGDRTDAYAHNHELRTADLIEHVGRGRYDTCLDERVADATDGRLDADERSVFVSHLAEMLDVPSDARESV